MALKNFDANSLANLHVLKRSDSGSSTDLSTLHSDSERSLSMGSDSPRSTKSDSELSVKRSQSQPSFVRQFSEKLTEAFSKLVRSATEPLPQKGLARTGGLKPHRQSTLLQERYESAQTSTDLNEISELLQDLNRYISKKTKTDTTGANQTQILIAKDMAKDLEDRFTNVLTNRLCNNLSVKLTSG